MTIKTFYLLLAVAVTASTSSFKLYKHQSQAAKCLDGSPAALYFEPGALSDKFVIYFEGGGLCRGDGLAETIEYCYKRSFTNLGSSSGYQDNRSFDSLSYLSSDPQFNPFHDWNRVFIPYCDGGVHQGSRLEPVQYKDRSLYFRGANNTLAHFQFLNNNFDLFAASEIIITGTSAGGLASYIWSNYVYDRALNPEGVLIVPDSGTFIVDFPNPYNNKTMSDYTDATYQLINQQTPMPLAQCVKHYPYQKECFQSGNLHQFIKPKMFILQSQYDSWGLIQILQLRCVPNVNPSTLEKCNDTQMAYIEQYRLKLNEAIQNLTSVQRNGVWSISCVQHGFLEDKMNFINSERYRVPFGSGAQINEALLAFRRGEGNRFIDRVNWPYNYGCNGQKKSINSLRRQQAYIQ